MVERYSLEEEQKVEKNYQHKTRPLLWPCFAIKFRSTCMKYAESLKKNYEFRTVYRKGKSLANKYLVVYKYKNNKNTNSNRIGISVSKKVGNSVVRSRVTRLIRESYRLSEENINHDGWDLVVIARSNANGASYADISNSLINLLKQHNMYV